MENQTGAGMTARLIGILMIVLGIAMIGAVVYLSASAHTEIHFPVPLYALVFAIIFNVTNLLTVKVIPSKLNSFISIFVNLATVMALVHFTGGLESEFYIAYFLIPPIAAIHFGRKGMIFSLLLIALSYGWFLFQRYPVLTASLVANFFLRIVFLTLVSSLFGIFIEHEQRYRRELEQSNEYLKETRAQLAQSAKMNALGQLSASIAHELDQPLASIRLYAQLVLSKLGNDSSLAEEVVVIRDQAERLNEIVKSVSDFSRQSGGQFVALNVNRPLEDALQLMSEQLALSKIKVNKNLSPELPPIVGNGNRLQQVFLNVIANARDAMLETDRDGEITIASRLLPRLEAGNATSGVGSRFSNGPPMAIGGSSAGEFIEITIADNGKGIPKEILDKVFEPFFTTKSSGRGLGLGLSISHRIIEDHSGFMEIQSREGSGTIIEFLLPIKGTRAAPRE